MTPLMTTFSRPEISGWKPAPSSMSAETFPSTAIRPDGGLEEAGDELQERGLAAAVRPDDAERLAARDRERHVRERGHDLGRRERRRQRAPEERRLERAERARPPPLAVALREPLGATTADGGLHTASGYESRSRSKSAYPRKNATHAIARRRPHRDGSIHRRVEERVAPRVEERRRRVEPKERAHALLLDVGERVEDGRREEPERQGRREEVLHVAEMDRERGEEESEPGDEDALRGRRAARPGRAASRGGSGGPKAPSAPRTRPARRTGRAKTKWRPCARTATSGSTSAGKRIFFRSAPCVVSDAAASVSDDESQFHGRRPEKRKSAYGDVVGPAAREDDREDDRVDREHEERVQERPEEPEDAAAIAGLQLAGDEDVGERAVAPQAGEVLQHAASIPTRASYVG